MPPRLYPLLDALLSDAGDECRRFGGMPDDLRLWLLDLHDLATDAPPLVEEPEPSEWVTTTEAATLFAAAGVPLSARSVRTLVSSGRLRGRRAGRRWLVGLEDVEAEIDARIGWGSSGSPAEVVTTPTDDDGTQRIERLEEAS